MNLIDNIRRLLGREAAHDGGWERAMQARAKECAALARDGWKEWISNPPPKSATVDVYSLYWDATNDSAIHTVNVATLPPEMNIYNLYWRHKEQK
jgi:hypothetical protein